MNTNIQMVPLILPHIGQLAILQAPHRFKVIACGRRWGKTELAKMILIHQALHQQQTWWIAPTYAMSQQVWRDLKLTLKNVSGMKVNETDHRLELPTGGIITIRSAHYPDHLRGVGLDYVVLDEAAYMSPDVWSEVVRPMLVDRQGSALLLSTPNGRNWFYDLFQQGKDPSETDWASFQFPSWTNPLISETEIASIRRTTSERVFQEEYEAQFLDDAGQVFRGIRRVVRPAPSERPIAGHRYVMGVDWGRDHDYTCLVVIDVDDKCMVALDRFHQIEWGLQRSRLQTLVNRWHPDVIWAESNSMGSPNIEILQSQGLPIRPFYTHQRSKATLIEGLALAIEREQLFLLPDETLLHELASYGMERLPAGGYRYSAPSGVHDDTVIALALAWHGAQQNSIHIDFA